MLVTALFPLGTQDAFAQTVDTLVVTGQVQFFAAGTDDSTSAYNGAFHGVHQAYVEVRDADCCFHATLVDLCTDRDGNFETDPLDNSDEDGSRDIYLRVGRGHCTPGVDLRDALDAWWWWTTQEDHRTEDTCKDGVNWDLPDGIFNIGECAGPERQDPWWTIKDYAGKGIDLAWAEGFEPGTVKVRVVMDHDGAHYHRDSDAIHIPDSTYANGPDVATHEVGHFIMDKVYAGDWPPGDCPKSHFFDQESNQGCAWREGWANFYAVQSFVGAPRWQDDSGVYDFAHDGSDPDGPEHPIETEPLSNTGPAVEGAVAGTLWDLVDDDNDDTNRDGVKEDVDKWTWSDVFEVFHSSAPVDTFTEFRDAWIDAKADEGAARRDLLRAACDNHIPEWDGRSPSGSVDAPSESLDGSYTVTWTSSDDECGVSKVHLEEWYDGSGTWSVACSGGASGSCSRNQEESGTYCYRAMMWDGAGGHVALSAQDCTDVGLGGGGDDGGAIDDDTGDNF